MTQVTLKQVNNWLIREDAFKIEQYKHFEGVFATGNGYLSIRGSFEEGIIGENQRSEERRVGKECRSRWSPYH